MRNLAEPMDPEEEQALDEEWSPEPWERPRPVGGTPSPVPARRVAPTLSSRPAQAPVNPPPAAPATKADADPRSRVILGFAVVYALVGLLSLGVSIVPMLATPSGWPRAVIVVILVLGIGLVVSRDEGPTPFSRPWVAGLTAAVVVLPLTTLAVSSAREPYISLAHGTAWTAIGLSALLCLVLAGIAIGMAVWSSDAPEESGLLTLPSALLVPAVIGMRGEIAQVAAARALGEVLLISAAATVIAWSLAVRYRTLTPPAAFGLQVVALWITGHGPSFQSTSGQIVPLLFALLFVMSVIQVVGTTSMAYIAAQALRDSTAMLWEPPRREPSSAPTSRPPLP